MSADALRMEPLEGFANLSAVDLARLTHSAERTARRWIREGLAPVMVVRWLQIVLRRPLGMLCDKWDGWSLRDGKLHAPDGVAFSTDEVRAIPLRLQQIRALEQQAAQLRGYQARETDAQGKPNPQRREPARSRGNGLDGVGHCSLKRRQIVSAAYPSADTIKPMTTPSAIRALESFTDA